MTASLRVFVCAFSFAVALAACDGGSATECSQASECDDANPCTTDSCEGGACAHAAANDGSPCDDGSFCTDGDVCAAGLCEPGAGSPCAGPTPACVEADDICAACLNDSDCPDDGAFCTGSEVCVNRACVSTGSPCPSSAPSCDESADRCYSCETAVDCDDGNPCTDDVCGVDGRCANANDDSNSCADDGVVCNGVESCVSGECSSDGVPACISLATPFCEAERDACVECLDAADCDDSNPCTDDACDAGVCTNSNNDANACPDDGVVCNGSEACVSGECQSDGAPTCVDVDHPFCDSTRDDCVACLSATDCDDGAFCNGAEACVDGVCVDATTDPCAGAVQGCDEIADRCLECAALEDCDDSDPCTADRCVDFACVHDRCDATCTPSGCGCVSATECDDGDPCTTDTCGTGGVCEWSAASSGACDDGLFCTSGDMCFRGACVALGQTCEGTTPICDESGSQCLACGSASDCDDGNACTDDACGSDGACTSTPRVCPDDGDPCTATACDAERGCTHVSLTDALVGITFEQEPRLLVGSGATGGVTLNDPIYLCDGPASCVSPSLSLIPAGVIGVPFDLIGLDPPSILAGELALASDAAGTVVCDYVRWGSSAPVVTTLGSDAETDGRWAGGYADTSGFATAPPQPGVCWQDAYERADFSGDNDAPSAWGYCPFCGSCDDGDPCTQDRCIEETQLCEHSDARSEVLASVDFGSDSVTLSSAEAIESLSGYGVCRAATLGDCVSLGGALDAPRVIPLSFTLAETAGELAFVAIDLSSPSGLAVCDYVRWSDASSTPPDALTSDAIARGQWTADTHVDTEGASSSARIESTASNAVATNWSVREP